MTSSYIAIVIGGLLNLIGLVWAASKLSAKLDYLAIAFSEHKKDYHEVVLIQGEHEVKLAVLWDGKERRNGVDNRRDP